jgi:hypothetical protein
MKTKLSYYVLLAEIITIVLFHIVKIKQTEKHLSDIVYTHTIQKDTLHVVVIKNNTAMAYMLMRLVK